MRNWTARKWKVTVGVLMASAFAGLAVWWILLGTICQAPPIPVAATGNLIQYNCHGSVVYITQVQSQLLHWLIPALFVIAYFGQWIIRRQKRT
jgi:hypothetical protein